MSKRDISIVVILATLIIGGIIVVLCGSNIVETVSAGTYKIKQAAVSGTMTAHMQPGMFKQMFGDITEWPNQETFYFTSTADEGDNYDQSMEVRFADGSKCQVSGSLRIIFPQSEDAAIALVKQHGFQTPKAVMFEAVKKHVRASLRLTANLMSARESYSEKRPNYLEWAEDMICGGLYKTSERTIEIIDPITDKKIEKVIKEVKEDENGNPIRIAESPFTALGIDISNFEINVFKYDPKVEAQIQQQQEALMAVATAKANAQRAQQEEKTKEAEGKALVMTAQYEKEQEKVRATVEAEMLAEVAVIEAQKLVDVANKSKEQATIEGEKRLVVADLDRQSAEQVKLEQIALGEGEAERKKLVMAADGALEKKLNALVTIAGLNADAYAKRQVPAIVIGGADGTDTDQQTNGFQTALMVKMLGDLDLELIKKAQAPATK